MADLQAGLREAALSHLNESRRILGWAALVALLVAALVLPSRFERETAIEELDHDVARLGTLDVEVGTLLRMVVEERAAVKKGIASCENIDAEMEATRRLLDAGFGNVRAKVQRAPDLAPEERNHTLRRISELTALTGVREQPALLYLSAPPRQDCFGMPVQDLIVVARIVLLRPVEVEAAFDRYLRDLDPDPVDGLRIERLPGFVRTVDAATDLLSTAAFRIGDDLRMRTPAEIGALYRERKRQLDELRALQEGRVDAELPGFPVPIQVRTLTIFGPSVVLVAGLWAVGHVLAARRIVRKIANPTHASLAQARLGPRYLKLEADDLFFGVGILLSAFVAGVIIWPADWWSPYDWRLLLAGVATLAAMAVLGLRVRLAGEIREHLRCCAGPEAPAPP